MGRKKVVWNEQTQETPDLETGEPEETESETASAFYDSRKALETKIKGIDNRIESVEIKKVDVNDDKILTSTKEELEAVSKDFGLPANLGNLRHKECYCVMSGKDNIVMAFIPDAFEPKSLGKIFQVIGEARLSMENSTTLSASTLFDRQVKPEEKPDPQKPLFKPEEE